MRHSRIATRFSLLTLACALAVCSSALGGPLQAEAERAVANAKLGKATLGVLVTDLSSGEDLVKINAETPLVPASNLKLLTTAAALCKLGTDHAFATQLRLDGSTLIVRGGGDPAFMDPVVLDEMGLTIDHVLDQWVEAVKRTGLKEFDAIVVDDRLFDREFVHPNWPRNQLHHWYCAQVAAINFNTNCLDFYASPATPGKAPTIRLVPDGVPVTVENHATTGSRKPLGLARHLGGNRLSVTGQIAQPLINPSFVTIHDPPLSFGGLLKNRLKRSGVEAGEVRRVAEAEAERDGRLLASVETPLPTVLLRTNRDSQNLFAEALFKYLGHETSGQPGSWANGRAAIEAFLSRVLGADASSVVLDDGSGLSRNNRVSPRAFVRVMDYMRDDEELFHVYRDSFAQPGQRGTLRKRFVNGELTGRIYAKSGYINGTITLSGYLEVSGRTIAFSMLLNNYAGGGADAKKMMEKILIAADKQLAKDPRNTLAVEPPALGG